MDDRRGEAVTGNVERRLVGPLQPGRLQADRTFGLLPSGAGVKAAGDGFASDFIGEPTGMKGIIPCPWRFFTQERA